jgi:6-phosphofructokinase 2
MILINISITASVLRFRTIAKKGGDMTAIFTLTLAPSLDSATVTEQIYPEGKLRCSSPVFEPGGGGINVARAIAHLGGHATAIFPVGGATGHHLRALLIEEQVTVDTAETKDWTRQNLHVHTESTGEQYRFVMPGAALSDEEFEQLEQKALAIPKGDILVISGSLPPGVAVKKLCQLVKAAQEKGIRCIVDSSGEALAATLKLGNIELVKPNQKELSALVQRELTQPDDVRAAAQHLVDSGQAKRVVVSLGPQGALAVDAHECVHVVPPPVKSQSTVGAGDSMVGAMTLKLAERAPLLDIVRYGVAAGSAATLNKGTRLCSLENTQKIYTWLQG